MPPTKVSDATSATHGIQVGPRTSTARACYLACLTWAFTIVSSVRIVTYIPGLLAIHASGDSSQHSVLMWGSWVVANATMAAWLYENNGQRFDRAVLVNCMNSLMCLATVVLIVWYQLA